VNTVLPYRFKPGRVSVENIRSYSLGQNGNACALMTEERICPAYLARLVC
jgi:hypothetical protein